jgi:Ca2+/H+ antiporter, TMEM165/GDT1 family
MDALVPLFIAILLAEQGGKTQALARVLGTGGRIGKTLAALLVTSIGSYVVAAVAGMLIGQLIAVEARNLMFAVALLAAGAPLLLRPASLPESGGEGSFGATLTAFVQTQFGDAAQFLVFAIAAKTAGVVLPVFGALLGVLSACLAPMLMGKDWPDGLPVRIARWMSAFAMIVIAYFLATRAMGIG